MRSAVFVAVLLLFPACRKSAAPVDAGAPAAPPPAEVKGPCASWVACRAACDAKDGPACARAATRAFTGLGTARDVPLGWQLEQQGCEAGHGPSCARVGLSAARGVAGLDAGLATDALAKAGPLLRTGCETGDAESCELAAALAQEGRLGADAGAFAERAQRLLGQGCTGGDAQACNRLGVLLFAADAGADAVAALERGCALGLAGACATLGLHYLDGNGVTADKPKGLALLSRARVLSADAGAP